MTMPLIDHMLDSLRRTASDRGLKFGVKTKLAVATALLIDAVGGVSPDTRDRLLDAVADQVRAADPPISHSTIVVAVEPPSLVQ